MEDFENMDIEYVIYCRKSTDESSGRQTQSIPDQIEKCMKYAEDNWLTIKKRPSDFSVFESEKEIFDQDNDPEWKNREIFQKYRWYFIVKEQQSWKIPYVRPKWRKLVTMINQGKVKWLLSYSPDRQARNIVEGWELIDFVDKWLIDLKYTNFYFEPNTSWKMMLWIWFVFSKQYSDKLGEDVRRWNKSAHAKWKAAGIPKYWYIIDKERGLHKPDPINFPIMQKAFKIKIYERKSDKEILKFLNEQWFVRPNWQPLTSNTLLWQVWRDPFYCWLFVKWKNVVNLNEVSDIFKPMITEDEHHLLIERLSKKSKAETNVKKKDEYECLSGLPFWMLVTKEEGHNFSRNIPNPKRWKKKLEEIRQKHPEITYEDILKSNNIYYSMKIRSAKKSIDIRFSDVESLIVTQLKKLKIDEDSYNVYYDYLSKEFDKITEKKKKERNMFQLRVNHLIWEKNAFMKSCLWKLKTDEERRLYEEKVIDYDRQIKSVSIETNNIIEEERNQLVEFEAMAYIIRNAYKLYTKWNYVQKAKITEILFSNIFVDKQKRLTFAVKPWLEWLFEDKNTISLGNQDSNLDKRSQSPVSYH